MTSGMGGPEVDQGQNGPGVTPPTPGRSSRRPEHITEARRLRDEVLALIEQKFRSEADLMQLTGRSKGEVKAALRRLAVANLVFSRETGPGVRDVSLWHHWPTVIAQLRASRQPQPVRVTERSTGMRVA